MSKNGYSSYPKNYVITSSNASMSAWPKNAIMKVFGRKNVGKA